MRAVPTNPDNSTTRARSHERSGCENEKYDTRAVSPPHPIECKLMRENVDRMSEINIIIDAPKTKDRIVMGVCHPFIT